MRRDVAAASVLRIRDRLAFQIEWSPFVDRPVPSQRGISLLFGAAGSNPVAVGRELRRTLKVSADLLDGGWIEHQEPRGETFILLGVDSAERMWPQIAMVQVFVSAPGNVDVHAVEVGPAFPMWRDLDRVVRSIADPDYELGEAVLHQLAHGRNSCTFTHA